MKKLIFAFAIVAVAAAGTAEGGFCRGEMKKNFAG